MFKVGDKVHHHITPDVYGVGIIVEVDEKKKMVGVTWEKKPEYGVCRDEFHTKRKLTKLELALK